MTDAPASESVLMAMQIRSYRSSDRDAIIDLWRRCELVVPWNDPKLDIARKLAHSAELLLVGHIDEQIVGSVMAGYDGHRGWINYLAVDPDCRRDGIGRQLVREVELNLRARGCPKLNLQIRETNQQVISFYEKLGYQRDPAVSMSRRLIADD